MTELYGSDGKTITNQNNYGQPAGGAQDEASALMRQNRPGLARMAERFAQQPAMGAYQQGQFDYSQGNGGYQQGQFRSSQPMQDSSSLTVPPLYGDVVIQAGMGPGTYVPSSVKNAVDVFPPVIQRHGTIERGQNGDPVWLDNDFGNTPPIRGHRQPGTGNWEFIIECPTTRGKRLDTIIVNPRPSVDGSIQAQMVSSYTDPSFPAKAMYNGRIFRTQEVAPQQMQPPQQMQGNSDAIGSVMPGTPVYNGGGMEQSSINPNTGAYNNGGDKDSIIANQQKTIDQQNKRIKQLQDSDGHPYRAAAVGFGVSLLGAAANIGMRSLMNGGYGNGYNYGRIPFVNGGGLPFMRNGNRRR
jgi:hypothetical protein